MVGIVVEDDEPADLGGIGDAHAFLPGRVAPVAVRGVFVVGIGGIVNHQVGALDEPHHVAVAPRRLVLGIGDVGDALAAVFDAVAGGAVGVVERGGADVDAGMRGQRVAGREIVEGELGGENADRRLQVAGPDAQPAARVVARGEKRQPDDVVEMRVAEQQVEVGRVAFLLQVLAEQANPRTGVEHQEAAAAAHLDAGGVAAVTGSVRPRCGDTSAHTPEADDELRIGQGPPPDTRTPEIITLNSVAAPPWQGGGQAAIFSEIRRNALLTNSGLRRWWRTAARREPPMSNAEYERQIAEFLRKKGVTRCPTACVVPTHATVADADRAALRDYSAAREAARLEKLRQYHQVVAA